MEVGTVNVNEGFVEEVGAPLLGGFSSTGTWTGPKFVRTGWAVSHLMDLGHALDKTGGPYSW